MLPAAINMTSSHWSPYSCQSTLGYSPPTVCLNTPLRLNEAFITLKRPSVSLYLGFISFTMANTLHSSTFATNMFLVFIWHWSNQQSTGLSMCCVKDFIGLYRGLVCYVICCCISTQIGLLNWWLWCCWNDLHVSQWGVCCDDLYRWQAIQGRWIVNHGNLVSPLASTWNIGGLLMLTVMNDNLTQVEWTVRKLFMVAKKHPQISASLSMFLSNSGSHWIHRVTFHVQWVGED